MERRFYIEAKSFRFSTKDGSSLIRLEERRKKFVGYIFVSPQCSSWLIGTVEAACLVKENVAKSFREGDKALMVHGGDNKAGRFLEVAMFAEGGRKGGLWLPEGRNGRGWRHFADELRILLAQTCLSSSSKTSPTKLVEAEVYGECYKDRTYAEILKSETRSCVEKKNGEVGSVQALRSTDGAVEKVGWSSRSLDLFPVPIRFESESVDEGVRFAVDCSALEDLVPGSLEAAAGSDMVPSSEVGEAGVMRLLGQLHLKMDRVLRVLGSTGFDVGHYVESGMGVDLGGGQIVDTRRDMVLDLGPDTNINPGTDPSTYMDSGTGLDPGSKLGSNKEFVSILKPLGSFLASMPEQVPVFLNSDAGLETQDVGDLGVISVQDRGGGSEVPERSPMLISDVGDLGEFSVQVRGGVSEAIDVGSCVVSAGRPCAEGYVAGEESGLPLSVVASTSEELIAIDAGDGFSHKLAPGFSVPVTEEFLGFLPAGSMSKDWEDFYSSMPMDRMGMSDSELLEEVFALPWEVEVPVSPSCRIEEVHSSGVKSSAPAKSLLRRGFLGPRAKSSPPTVVSKEVLPVIKGKDSSLEVGSSVPATSVPVISPGTVVLPSTQVCSSSGGTVVTEPIPINSSISLSQGWYNRRVKEKAAKQLNKNKEVTAEAVGVIPVVGEDRVADALNLAPVLGLSWGGEDKKLRDLVEVIVPKAKGMRELKNLDCAISPVKGKRQRGWLGSKNASSFPPEVH
jgi:hypothetical protein